MIERYKRDHIGRSAGLCAADMLQAVPFACAIMTRRHEEAIGKQMRALVARERPKPKVGGTRFFAKEAYLEQVRAELLAVMGDNLWLVDGLMHELGRGKDGVRQVLKDMECAGLVRRINFPNERRTTYWQLNSAASAKSDPAAPGQRKGGPSTEFSGESLRQQAPAVISAAGVDTAE